MKYRHSTAQSADYLRLALKRMSQQDAGLHPASYALWYEYVAGTNPVLKAAVDAQIERDGQLNEATTHALYARHVADFDTQTASRIGDSVNQIVEQISESATTADEQASRFGGSLASWSDALNLPTSHGSLASSVEDILRGTREMQAAIGVLQTRLEESRREVQQLRQEVARAREEALIDALTGLTNRKGFDLALDACLKEVTPETHGPCLLMIDLDHFKRLNDTLGHVFGDQVLSSVGQILRANVKGKDTATRYGGEEFAVILPQTPRGGAIGLAEALRATVFASRVRRSGKKEAMIGNISVSIGVADHIAGESATEFVSRADRALYTAKAQGRNRVVLAPRPQSAGVQ
ncbi:MAG: GGDEF domain-containing protein [Candidatus Accumulibacter phosphatis]|uniref:diguanylate cyclase n=2 Tax=Candidatus Accumulibacter TaxID=327159 RepID=A0A080M9H1_9PROT|nr:MULTISPECIES: GGDEF domain-containing protein [Candidatus Accumulibacter]KFB77080.1 MAG: Stalked cell differentiation-controlling protein [Candidatus Accumulibacter cognatus]MBL8402762.1 GGDEF domain-containing protein [Accumulibacter sp.]MBN8517991.1 GGDEF domain-containing protein [Accumulibacter sp.]MBO3710406.1 GGDEF domain-containing protein [Accumulibacter sp.]MCC2868379.1 GGDEF domain-containing protein [Candidatus Accumulibacter phosphatis]